MWGIPTQSLKHGMLFVPNKLRQYLLLMRFDKPIGILLLLWPTLWALWIAGNGHPDWSVVIIFVLGVIFMRSAGCIMNDVADRNFDGRVERTKKRPLATGAVSVKEALVLFSVLCVCAAGLVLLLNWLTVLLAVIGLCFAVVYPFLKRVTHLPQFVLGIAFSWSIPMAFAALTGRVPAIAWYVFVMAAMWPVIYDTMYAMVDREDDLVIGLKSTAILFGSYDRMIVGVLQVVMLAFLFYLSRLLALNVVYYIGLVIAASLFGYQQVLIKDRNPSYCFRAFLNNNWFGLVVFVSILFGYL